MRKNIVGFPVDLQKDFGHPHGILYCKGGYEVVGGSNILIAFILKNMGKVLYSCEWHETTNKVHFIPNGPWPVHCIRGTWGAQLLDGLTPPQYPCIVFKGMEDDQHGYNPFDGKNISWGTSTIEEVIGKPEETTIIVWGIATNFCVRAMVLTALKRGYEVYVVLDACRAVPTPLNPPTDFVSADSAIIEMKAAGAIMTTVEEVVYAKF